ncbi:hypothetical protein GEMRC1_009841 [Eukaryota sp. GEM-RC1]
MDIFGTIRNDKFMEVNGTISIRNHPYVVTGHFIQNDELVVRPGVSAGLNVISSVFTTASDTLIEPTGTVFLSESDVYSDMYVSEGSTLWFRNKPYFGSNCVATIVNFHPQSTLSGNHGQWKFDNCVTVNFYGEYQMNPEIRMVDGGTLIFKPESVINCTSLYSNAGKIFIDGAYHVSGRWSLDSSHQEGDGTIEIDGIDGFATRVYTIEGNAYTSMIDFDDVSVIDVLYVHGGTVFIHTGKTIELDELHLYGGAIYSVDNIRVKKFVWHAGAVLNGNFDVTVESFIEDGGLLSDQRDKMIGGNTVLNLDGTINWNGSGFLFNCNPTALTKSYINIYASGQISSLSSKVHAVSSCCSNSYHIISCNCGEHCTEHNYQQRFYTFGFVRWVRTARWVTGGAFTSSGYRCNRHSSALTITNFGDLVFDGFNTRPEFAVNLINRGTIQIKQGEVLLNGGGSSTGNWSVHQGSILAIGSRPYTFEDSSVVNQIVVAGKDDALLELRSVGRYTYFDPHWNDFDRNFRTGEKFECERQPTPAHVRVFGILDLPNGFLVPVGKLEFMTGASLIARSVSVSGGVLIFNKLNPALDLPYLNIMKGHVRFISGSTQPFFFKSIQHLGGTLSGIDTLMAERHYWLDGEVSGGLTINVTSSLIIQGHNPKRLTSSTIINSNVTLIEGRGFFEFHDNATFINRHVFDVERSVEFRSDGSYPSQFINEGYLTIRSPALAVDFYLTFIHREGAQLNIEDSSNLRLFSLGNIYGNIDINSPSAQLSLSSGGVFDEMAAHLFESSAHLAGQGTINILHGVPVDFRGTFDTSALLRVPEGEISFHDGTVIVSPFNILIYAGFIRFHTVSSNVILNHVEIHGGSIDFLTGRPGTIEDLVLESGLRGGTDVVSVTNSLLWASGGFGPHSTTISLNSMLILKGEDKVLHSHANITNVGHCDFTSESYMSAASESVFFNAPGAFVEIISDVDIVCLAEDHEPPSLFINEGVVHVDARNVKFGPELHNYNEINITFGSFLAVGGGFSYNNSIVYSHPNTVFGIDSHFVFEIGSTLSSTHAQVRMRDEESFLEVRGFLDMNFARLLTSGTMNIRSTANIHPNLDLFIGGTSVNFDPRDHEVTLDKVEARFGELNLFTGHPVFFRHFILNGALVGGNDMVYIVHLDWSHGHFSGGNTVNLDKGVIESHSLKSIMTNTILTNAGNLELKEGNVMGEAGSVFHNNGSGYMSICGNAGFLTSNSSVFINDGIINKTCSNAFDMNWSINQSSTGRININDGTFALTGTDNEFNGSIFLSHKGVLSITSTTEFKGNGEFVVDKGEIRIEPGAELIFNNFIINVTKGSSLQIISGTVQFLNGTTVGPIDLIISDGIAVFEDVNCPLILPHVKLTGGYLSFNTECDVFIEDLELHVGFTGANAELITNKTSLNVKNYFFISHNSYQSTHTFILTLFVLEIALLN